MKYRFLFITFFVFGVFGFAGCSDDEDPNNVVPCSGQWAVEVEDEINAWMSAAQQYASNPNQENCNAYKAAAQDYLDALEPYGDCATLTGEQRAEWEAAIQEAQESLNNSDCN